MAPQLLGYSALLRAAAVGRKKGSALSAVVVQPLRTLFHIRLVNWVTDSPPPHHPKS